METINTSQSRLLYNPQLQTAEMTEKLFVVRQKLFDLLLNNLLKEKADSIPQHYLIVGQRGMGKTTMLKRLEVELHKEQYRQQFIPLLFREEQYDIKDLADFWLNNLDALADCLEHEEYPAQMVEHIDKTIKELSSKTPETISTEAYQFLMDTCRGLNRRPVLLIDNIDIVFRGLDSTENSKQQQWALRKLLSENGAPIIVSGGVTTTADVTEYQMPFYDFFKIQYLKKLNYEEFVELLTNLATINNSDKAVFRSIQQNTSRQKALLELTGGSPRMTVILFDQISKGYSSNISDDLNILADAVTPLYKAKFEELSQQQRNIVGAIALNWDAISLRKLAAATRMKSNQLSPQLKRLTDEGWIETTPAYEDKGNAYYISERFFNIYYLIRNSSRRHRDKVYCLSKFLECFYGSEELEISKRDFVQLNLVAEPKIKLDDDVFSTCSCYLNKAIVELDGKNVGNAKEYLLLAFQILEKGNKLASIANEHWGAEFTYSISKLDACSWLLDILEEKGYDVILSPYYTAIQTLEIEKRESSENAILYLNNRAKEISEPAKVIAEKIRKYVD